MIPKNTHDMLKENKQEMKLFNLTCMYLFTQMEESLLLVGLCLDLSNNSGAQ